MAWCLPETGAGALRRPVLVALGLRPDGKKEIIDFRLAASESAEWEKFLTDFTVTGSPARASTAVGGAACWLPCRSSCTAFPCSAAGLTRSGTSSTKSARPTSPSQALTPKVALHKVMHAHNQPAAPSAARQFADRFEEGLPQCGCMPARRPRRTAHLLPLQIRGATSKVRTPNAIERRFREVRRPTRPMGTFQDKTRMDRILFAVFLTKTSHKASVPLSC